MRKALYRLGSTKHLFNRDLYLLIRKEGSIYKAYLLSLLVILIELLLRKELEGISLSSLAPIGIYIEIYRILIL